MATSADEYLEAIYNLTMEGEPVIAARLAEKFGVSAPTISEMINKRLVRDDLVALDAQRHLVLTSRGRAIAENSLRRHRLAEQFLVQIMGMDWVQAHEEAHTLQHSLTPAFQERMVALLGDPQTCPHGNPIPRSDVDPLQFLRERQALRLSAVPLQTPVEVVCISEVVEDETALLRYLGDRKIKPGRRLLPVEQTPDNRVLLVNVDDGAPTAIERTIADKIWVRRVTSAEY